MTQTIATLICATKQSIKTEIGELSGYIFFSLLPALGNFASQVYYMPGDYFMLQSIIGIERTISLKQHSLRQ